jgi:hypothetical protein
MASAGLRRSSEFHWMPTVSHQARTALRGCGAGAPIPVEKGGSWRVTAYGLGIETRFPLPELTPGAATVDVVIRQGSLPARPQAHQDDAYYAHATDREAYLSWSHMGTFLVRDGREIIVDSAGDERTLRVYLLGAVLGVVLRQRGRLVAHASAVEIGGRVVAFMGASGQGKSTMAAALHAKGYALITDDLLAFRPINREEHPTVTPGFPRLKLFPDSLRALGQPPDDLPVVQPSEDKRLHAASPGFSLRERPLGHLYVLAEGAEPKIEPLGPQAAFVELLRHTSAARSALTPADNVASCLRQTAELVNQVPICRLTVPRSFDRLSEVARLVEEDALSN